MPSQIDPAAAPRELEPGDVAFLTVTDCTPVGAFVDWGEPNVWLRKSVLLADVKSVTACIFHEAAHVAGAPGDTLAEVALDTVHKAAGMPRVP